MEQQELPEKLNQSEHENRQMLGREEQKEVNFLPFCLSFSSSFPLSPFSSLSVFLGSPELPGLEDHPFSTFLLLLASQEFTSMPG